jgi:dienelactone hydrolase
LFGKNTIPSPPTTLPDPHKDTPELFRSIERTHMTYEVEDRVKVEAYILRQKNSNRTKNPQRTSPGIVLFHSSGPDALEVASSIDPGLQMSIAAHLAKKGYVVLCPKCFIYGEDFNEENPRAHHTKQVRNMLQKHPDWKGMARMIWDGRRAVEVLVKEDDVNPDKIGAIGHSLGGKQVLFVMAFDSRIKAGVSSDGGIGLTFSNWQDVWYLGEKIRRKSVHLRIIKFSQ